MNKSLFSNLPNDLIMKIIKINTDKAMEEKLYHYWRWRFSACMFELRYEGIETEYYEGEY